MILTPEIQSIEAFCEVVAHVRERSVLAATAINDAADAENPNLYQAISAEEFSPVVYVNDFELAFKEHIQPISMDNISQCCRHEWGMAVRVIEEALPAMWMLRAVWNASFPTGQGSMVTDNMAGLGRVAADLFKSFNKASDALDSIRDVAVANLRFVQSDMRSMPLPV